MYRVLLLLTASLLLAACARHAPAPGGAPAPVPAPVAAVPSDPPSHLASRVRVAEQSVIPLTDGVLAAVDPSRRFQLGIDRLVREDFHRVRDRRLLVATNRLALDGDGIHTVEHLARARSPIVSRVVLVDDELPAPARSAALDSVFSEFPRIRVFQRPASNPAPTATMFDDIDLVVIDVAMRPGRFRPEAGFLGAMLAGASMRGIPVLVLDRPIASGARLLDGPTSAPELAGAPDAFFPVPAFHGLTPGELARLYNSYFGVGAELDVLALSGWRPADGFAPLWQAFDRAGVNPAAQLPEFEAYVPRDEGAVLLEAAAALMPRGVAAHVGEQGLTLVPTAGAAGFSDAWASLSGVAAACEPTTRSLAGVIEEAVRIVPADGFSPSTVAVAVWYVEGAADPGVLPGPGEPGPFANPFVFDAIRDRRQPLALRQAWSSTPLALEIESRRQRVLLY